MADSKIRIAAVGSKSEGINEINPRFQAEALRNIRGIDCGVLDNSFYSEDVDPYGVTKTANPDSFMFPIDISSYTVSIGRGMATAYGYDFQTEETIAITTLEDGTPLSQLSPGTATYYLFVYLEWNLAASPAEGSIKIHNNGTASIWRSLVTENSSNNLIRIPSGTYKLPIWRFTCTSTGLGNAVSWKDMNLCPTITRPQVAEVARFADDPTGVGDEIANTRYVNNRVDDALSSMQNALTTLYNSFDSGTTTILNVPVTLQRENGLVYMTCENSSIITSGLEPSWGAWTKALKDMAVGDSVGYIENEKYRPSESQGDVEIRVNMYYYLSSATEFSGTTGLYFTIQPNGYIILAAVPTETVNNSSLLPKFAIGDYRFHVGWKCAGYETPEIYRVYDVTKSVSEGVCAKTLPSTVEANKTYQIDVQATEYAKECYVRVWLSQSDGNRTVTLLTAYGNGTFDFTTPTENTTTTGLTGEGVTKRFSGLYDVCNIEVSTRYYDDGTPDA